MKRLSLKARQAIVIITMLGSLVLALLLLFGQQNTFEVMEFLLIKTLGFGFLVVFIVTFRAIVPLKELE